MTTTVPRFEEISAPSDWRTVDFISDLHLQASEPATFEAWRRYMQATDASAVFILGDLFEVWVGDDCIDDAEGAFEAECCAVLRGAAHLRPIFFMHGNRDFLIGPRFLTHCGLTGLHDPTVLQFGGGRTVLSHGDLLCLDDVDYQRFRVQARSTEWQQRFLSQTLAVRRAQARGIREQSEARKQSSDATYADLDGPASREWLQAAGASTLIHGHTHRPGVHSVGPGLQRVVLSDWDAAAHPPRAEVLRLSPGQGLERLTAVPM